ncbi:uncharacterized protein IL334_002142 [Kwoniella shivajii]|uniref:ER membrane protein complex subunit 1 n=1 Tax=Kwoniella shivajii TaxID=564305 RepID=A0ABZ1CTV8_9TREE|nr:hypothetical protein IL334_002142 [Kwoniella shivajii]
MIVNIRGLSLIFTFFSISFLASVVVGLQADLAGIVDWHLPLIGEYILEPTPPLYVLQSQSQRNDGEGRIIGLTKKNVLAVLNAENGDIAWRHQFELSDPVISFHVKDDNVLLLSGSGGSTIRLFSLSTGSLSWEKSIVPSEEARLTIPAYLGTDAAFVPSKQGEEDTVVVLTGSSRVSKFRLSDGGLLWSMESPGSGSTILFNQLIPTGSSVHILGFHSQFTGQSLLTSTLDISTSIPKADFGQVPSIIEIPSQALIASSTIDGEAKVVWIEHGRIRIITIKEDGNVGKVKDLLPRKGKLYESIIDVGVRRKGIILGKRSDGAVDVISVSQSKKLEEFELSANSPERSESIYSGTETKNGVILNRVYWSFNMAVGAAQTINIPNVDSSDIITSGFTFQYDTLSHGTFIHAAVSPTLNDKQLPTLVLTTSNGAIQRMELDNPGWVREESLSDIKAARFVDLGEPETEEVREVLAEEGFAGRLSRHLVELKDLPGYLFRFAKRFTSASYTSALQVTPLNTTHLHRDQFGFQKLLIAATAKGKLFALDSSNGAAIWSRNLGLTSAGGSEIDIQDMWNVRDGEGGREPMLAILATKVSKDKETLTTVAYHLNAYTGLIAGEVDPVNHLPLGKTLFEGKPQNAFLLPFENCGTKASVLAVIDSSNDLHIFPPCKKVAAGIEEISDSLFYSVISRGIDETSVKGFIPSAAREGGGFKGELIWQLPIGASENILENKAVIFDSISSFGRVLGDKSTLYKYLNPHLQVISTFTPSQRGVSSVNLNGIGKIYVVDTTNGNVVYQTQIDGVKERGGIKVGMVENWLVFSWLDERGWRIGSTELFEDTESKGVTPSQSSFQDVKINAVSQSFILPTEVKAIGFTTSKAGITTKEVLIVNGKNQIASIPRRLLDPRRPTGKPTSRDKEEILIPYEALIPLEPKKVISHKYEVLGAKTLLTSAALVESTSLLFAYGLDLFVTRGITPAGTFDILSDNFNKVQLLLTLGALTAGIVVAGPAVKRKELKNKWY